MNFLSLFFAKYLGIFDDISNFLKCFQNGETNFTFWDSFRSLCTFFFHSCLGVVHIEIELGSNTTQPMSSIVRATQTFWACLWAFFVVISNGGTGQSNLYLYLLQKSLINVFVKHFILLMSLFPFNIAVHLLNHFSFRNFFRKSSHFIKVGFF